jgi:hypothetical protein
MNSLCLRAFVAKFSFVSGRGRGIMIDCPRFSFRQDGKKRGHEKRLPIGKILPLSGRIFFATEKDYFFSRAFSNKSPRVPVDVFFL